jgi:transposase-like protein
VHKTVNILDKMPKSVQGKAKQLIHEMYLAPTRKAALAAYERSGSKTSPFPAQIN